MTIESLDQTYLPKFIESFQKFWNEPKQKSHASKDATLFLPISITIIL